MNPTPENDLDALLRRADPAAVLSPVSPERFASRVRERIRAAGPARNRWHEQFLPLAAALAVLASLGAGSAVAYARQRNQNTDFFAAAYARSVDPWLMHATSRDQTPGSHQ